jgi:hypothetical protein
MHHGRTGHGGPEEGKHMSITKLKPVGHWGVLPDDLTRVGSHLGGRRVITGMLTGSEPLLPPAPPAVARIAGTRPGTIK